MDLAAVMDEVATRLKTISGLRVFAQPQGPLSPPTAVVGYPEEYIYDATYGRGMDRMTIPIVLAVGKVADHAARNKLAEYVDGVGEKSLKAVLEVDGYTTFDVVRVMSVEFDVYTQSGVDYLAAIFALDIAGVGD